MSEELVKCWILTSEDIEKLFILEKEMKQFLNVWMSRHDNYFYRTMYKFKLNGEFSLTIDVYEEH